MIEFIELALSLPATIYGLGERNCGDVDRPVACAEGAVTASGEPFNPHEIAAAVPAPEKTILRPLTICLLSKDGKHVYVRINDKANSRWIGHRGLDLTPGAWKALGYEPTRWHSAKLRRC